MTAVTFASIAWKNARKKFGSYLAYFCATLFSVSIFYLFCAMYFNPAFEAYRFGTGKMNTLFKASAIAVLLFATVFTLYSGNYFIKTQKKEIAVYSLLGMRKEQIAKLMFLETFFIGILAVVCGTLIGMFSSGYFTGLLTRFMAVQTSVALSFKPQSVFVTLIVFCALFGVGGYRAYQTIYRYQLIDLLSAAKQTEGVPSFSIPGAFASIALLLAGYVMAALMNLNLSGTKLLLPALLVILLISLGTYLLFANFVPMALSAFKRKRNRYYRTTSFISVSQIAFRLKGNSRMLAVVSVLCAVTITMVSASYSLYRGLEDSVDFYAPYSYLAKNISDEQHAQALQAVTDTGEVSVTFDDTIPIGNVEIQSADYAVQEGKEAGQNPGAAVSAYLLSESKYLDVIGHTQAPAGDYANTKTSFSGGLSDTECYFLDGNVTSDYCKPLIGKPLNVRMGGQDAQYTVTGAALHKYVGMTDLYQHPTVVVSDPVFARYLTEASDNAVTTFTGLMFDDEMASGNTVAAIDAIIPARFTSGGLPGNISYIEMYRANFALYGSYVFIGLFIGILFLLAVGSVLYYKLIMEAQEEAPRYEILRKTGMTKREACASVAKQLGLVYGIPLGVGLVHTFFALTTYNRMMEEIGQETPTFLNALLVVLLYLAAYGLFYTFSVRNYFRIAWRHEGGRGV